MKLKNIVMTIAISAAVGCVASSCQQTQRENPLLVKSQLPYGAPDFSKIKTSDYLPAFESAIQEQRDKIELAAVSNGEKLYHGTSFSQVFYDSLFSHAQQQLQRVPIAWANDAHQELRELNEGKVREEGRGLHR